MNLADAKNIPIEEVIQALGARFYRQTKPHEVWYYSFLRKERHASCKVDLFRNSYNDFGDYRKPGSTIDAPIDRWGMERDDPKAINLSLQFLENFNNLPRAERQPMKLDLADRFEIKGFSEITKRSPKHIIAEISRRRWGIATAAQFLQVAEVYDRQEKYKFKCFSMENIKGGFELHNYDPSQMETRKRKFKGVKAPHAISVFDAHPDHDDGTAIGFSSKMDLVTYAQLCGGKKPNETLICYHGDSMIGHCAEYVEEHSFRKFFHFSHWDESRSGQKADSDLGAMIYPYVEVYGNMEHLLKNPAGGHYKDLSEARMKNEHGLTRAFRVDTTIAPSLGNGYRVASKGPRGPR